VADDIELCDISALPNTTLCYISRFVFPKTCNIPPIPVRFEDSTVNVREFTCQPSGGEDDISWLTPPGRDSGGTFPAEYLNTLCFVWAVNLKAYMAMFGLQFALVGFVTYSAEPLFTTFIDEMHAQRTRAKQEEKLYVAIAERSAPLNTSVLERTPEARAVLKLRAIIEGVNKKNEELAEPIFTRDEAATVFRNKSLAVLYNAAYAAGTTKRPVVAFDDGELCFDALKMHKTLFSVDDSSTTACYQHVSGLPGCEDEGKRLCR